MLNINCIHYENIPSHAYQKIGVKYEAFEMIDTSDISNIISCISHKIQGKYWAIEEMERFIIMQLQHGQLLNASREKVHVHLNKLYS